LHPSQAAHQCHGHNNQNGNHNVEALCHHWVLREDLLLYTLRRRLRWARRLRALSFCSLSASSLSVSSLSTRASSSGTLVFPADIASTEVFSINKALAAGCGRTVMSAIVPVIGRPIPGCVRRRPPTSSTATFLAPLIIAGTSSAPMSATATWVTRMWWSHSGVSPAFIMLKNLGIPRDKRLPH